MGRGVIIALGLSLAANVFMGGMIAGKIAGGPHHRGGAQGFGFHHRGAEDFADLPPAAREALKKAFAERRDAGAERRRAGRALHEELIAVLRADEFDRAAADEIVAKIETVEIAGRADLARLLVETAGALSPADRKALADHLDRRAKRRRGPPPPDSP